MKKSHSYALITILVPTDEVKDIVMPEGALYFCIDNLGHQKVLDDALLRGLGHAAAEAIGRSVRKSETLQ